MSEVELHQAFCWDCDECGRENFCRAVTCELTPSDRAEMKEADGTPLQGEWVCAPDTVECAYCKAEFVAKHQMPE